MATLSSIEALLGNLESAQLSVDARKCVKVRNRNVECTRCAAACAGGCITVSGNELAVDPQHCIGCGTCATACPTDAITPRNPDDRALARAAAAAMKVTDDIAVFACADIAAAAQDKINPDTLVAVPCVGRLDESLIVLLATAGAKEVRLVVGKCEMCPHAPGRDAAYAVCQSAQELLRVHACACKVHTTGTLPVQCKRTQGETYDANRREFFLAAGTAARDVAHDSANAAIDAAFNKPAQHPALIHVRPDGTLPHWIPPRRQLLLSCLHSLGTPVDDLIETRLWGHVVIDAQTCAECRMCAVFCPTGALVKIGGDDGRPDVGLAHAPGLCVKCRTCEQICQTGALSLSDEVFARDLTAGVVERRRMKDVTQAKGGPDAIRASMAQKLNTAYLWG